MQYRLLATDMDGTLLKNNKTISEENLGALKEAVSMGMELIICTGRPYGALKPYLNQIGNPCWLVTNNGAVIRDKNKKIVRVVKLKQSALETALNVLIEEDIYYHGADQNYTYTNSYWQRTKLYQSFMRNQGLSWAGSWIFAMGTVLFKDSHRKVNIPDYVKGGGSLCSLFVYDEDRERLAAVKKRLEQIPHIQVTSSGKHNLELLDPMATKGAALGEVAKEIKIPPEEIMAVGDQLNDLSMIKYAGLGIAMANAENTVLEAADWVTKSNEEHGIRHILEEKIFKGKKQLKETLL